MSNDQIYRQDAIDVMCELMHHWFGGDPKDEIREIKRELEKLPSAQPELIEKTAYIRGFEQGRTQGMIDAQGGKEMNKQRKVLITITYNEMGIIIDTKAEEFDLSAQPTQSNTSNTLNALDCVSRQAAIDAIDTYIGNFDALDANFLDGLKTAKKLIMQLPSAQPEQRWIPMTERYPDEGQEVLIQMTNGYMPTITFSRLGVHDHIVAWMPLPEPWKEGETDA